MGLWGSGFASYGIINGWYNVIGGRGMALKPFK